MGKPLADQDKQELFLNIIPIGSLELIGICFVTTD